MTEPPWDTTPPPIGFATGHFYTKPLTIYLQEGRLWIWDSQGFLCSLDASEVHRSGFAWQLMDNLMKLLEAEASRPSDSPRKHLRQSARNLIHPGYAERHEEEMIALDKAVNETVRKQRERKTAAASTPIDLVSLGLLKEK